MKACPVFAVIGQFCREYRCVIVVFAASRLLIATLILLSQTTFARGIYWYRDGILPTLMVWDAERWYVDIARHGYYFIAGDLSNVGFFPLYPLLIRLAAYFCHDYRIAAVLVSNGSLFAALVLFHRLIREDYPEGRIANTAATFLAFSPVSFFFSAGYTESTFLLLSLGAVLAAARGNWLVGCLCAGALSATRNVGVIIGLPLFIEYLRQNWKSELGLRSLLRPGILCFGLVPSGLLLFLAFNYFRFDDPFAYVKATAVWGRRFASPLRTFATPLVGPWGADAVHEQFHRTVSITALSVGIAAFIGTLYFKLRVSYVVYCALLLIIYLCGNSLEAMPRYLSVVFPLFISAALFAADRRTFYYALLALSCASLALMTALEATGFWIT
jgi:hypothetical protein